jgi:hypothetical protein
MFAARSGRSEAPGEKGWGKGETIGGKRSGEGAAPTRRSFGRIGGPVGAQGKVERWRASGDELSEDGGSVDSTSLLLPRAGGGEELRGGTIGDVLRGRSSRPWPRG